ncbi:MAG: hypothetical protein QF475_01750, partial [Candidatus Undinarchaeales archaeon]|nr:hypothetical protein [Candidatus Undinarchaeales archaeon]
MKNKEDIFLIGLIIVIIVLVVALFMTPARVAVVDGEGEGSASINIADPPREAIERQNTPDPIIRPVETPVVTSEPEPEPEPEEEPEEVIITLASGRFTPNDIEIESGTMVTFIS